MPNEPIMPFAGVRILDLTHRYGRYATRLFADHGAEVIRIEPPSGLADRQGDAPGETPLESFAFAAAGKRSVVLDLGEDWDGFAALVRTAAMVFVERDGPAFDRLAELRRLQPTAVITAISPYGLGGPLADAPASDLTLQAAGGIAWMSGRPGEPPLRLPGEQAEMMGSVYAATASAMALFDAERRGHGHLIDVSVQECVAHSLQNAIQVWDLERRVSLRGGEGTRDATEDIFACKDGHVFLASPLALAASWRQLVAWMKETGHPSGTALEEACWADANWRTTRKAKRLFRKLFEDFVRAFDKREVTREAIARRIVLGPVSRIGELMQDEQLLHRGFFSELDAMGTGVAAPFPGPPFRLDGVAWQARPAPRLGADTAAYLDDGTVTTPAPERRRA